MNAYIHLIISTTFSMFITFLQYCIFHQTRVDSSIIQQYVCDVNRDYFLTMRCWIKGRNDLITCWRLMDRRDSKPYLYSIFLWFLIFLVLLYGLRLLIRIRPMIQTPLIVWLLGRYCEDKHLCYQVDVFTVYLLVWQCIYLMCKWEEHDLSYPFLILQQGSLCVSASFVAFFYYDFIFRYLTIQFNFALLWLWSLYDVFTCLHIHGRLRKMFLNTSSAYSPPGLYYPYDFGNIEINEIHFNDNNNSVAAHPDNDHPSLGIGDFIAFNLMSLLIIDPLWSITTKLYVLIGCIVSIQIGHFIMRIVQCCWQESCMPVLPFCVIPFSTYAIFVYHFMYNTITESISTQSCT